MRRGFKTWAESEAENRRQLAELSAAAALSAKHVAEQLEIRVTTPAEMGVDETDLGVLLKGEKSHWSAMTLYFHGEPFVVHNPTHSEARQESDLMHEFAHLICKHPPSRIIKTGLLPFPMREYNSEHEDEADWLAGALKVPRKAMLTLVRRGASTEDLASHFQCSLAMARMRRNRTGVDSHIRRLVANGW